LTYHNALALKWRTTILSHLPETYPPDSYADLLPDVSEEDPTIEGGWQVHHWREPKDWVEDPAVLSLVFGIAPEGTDFSHLQ